MRQSKNRWNNRGPRQVNINSKSVHWLHTHVICFTSKGQIQIKNREASVIVQPSWKIIEEMDFPRLNKLSLRLSHEASDL